MADFLRACQGFQCLVWLFCGFLIIGTVIVRLLYIAILGPQYGGIYWLTDLILACLGFGAWFWSVPRIPHYRTSVQTAIKRATNASSMSGVAKRMVRNFSRLAPLIGSEQYYEGYGFSMYKRPVEEKNWLLGFTSLQGNALSRLNDVNARY